MFNINYLLRAKVNKIILLNFILFIAFLNKVYSNDNYRKSNFEFTLNFANHIDDETEVFIEAFGTIILPPEMEIQSGNYKIVNDKLKEIIGIESSNVIFQQIGLNNFSKNGFSNYARIMIKTDVSNSGTYPNLDNLTISKKELKEIENEIKSELINSLSAINTEITAWYPISKETIGNYTALKVSYDRKLNNNPEVEVEQYMIFNNDRMHMIIFSNRIEDNYVWKPIFDNVKMSIDIIER